VIGCLLGFNMGGKRFLGQSLLGETDSAEQLEGQWDGTKGKRMLYTGIGH
jgi:hypothetical protein